ncbi:hypothetical protein [Bacteriophage sp.]|nr:hypothetical protein [Bacteriophage sp.]UOF80127.1 hypothetical protein [Bacteriophage sp.]
MPAPERQRWLVPSLSPRRLACSANYLALPVVTLPA